MLAYEWFGERTYTLELDLHDSFAYFAIGLLQANACTDLGCLTERIVLQQLDI